MPTIKNAPLVLHIRLTKYCHADCHYCSSWQEKPDQFMTSENLLRSLEFLFSYFNITQSSTPHVTIEYVGGEVLAIPFKYFEESVYRVRDFFKTRHIQFKDGLQSNLLASPSKVSRVISLFDGRVSSSLEKFSHERTFLGDSNKYKVIFKESDSTFMESTMHPVPCVLTVTHRNFEFIEDEVKLANRENRDLTIRPLFIAGKNKEQLHADDFKALFVRLFDAWFFRQRIYINPFVYMLESRINSNNNFQRHNSCAFHANCIERSLCIEPNGDVYVCQEMADSKQYCIGNALSQEMNSDVISLLAERPQRLSSDCLHCDYVDSCQGGCMSEAISNNNGVYGKPEFCVVWKNLFKIIDSKIEQYGVHEIRRWLDKLSV